MKRPTVLLSFALLAGLVLFPMRAYAAAASISFVPSVTSVTTSEVVTVAITEDSGSEPVNAVQANVSYPVSLLQYVSTSNSAAFTIDAQTIANNGTIQLARGAYSPATGSQPVATLTFEVLGSTGTANLSFTSGTAVVSATSNTDILSTEAGVSLTLTAPASTGGSTGTGNQTSTGSGAGSNSSQGSCTTACDTRQNPAPTTTAQGDQQPTTTLVNTGTDLWSVLGIGSLAAAVSYIAALSYRKFMQR